MKAVIQRVLRASVQVEGREVAKIGPGILTLLGVEEGDEPPSCEKMISKIVKLRVFPDSSGKMNLSLADTGGGHLLVSQFTLLGDLSKGNRPSFVGAGSPEKARQLFDHAVQFSRNMGINTESGVFQADMQVELVNDGPATFLLEMSGDPR